LVPTFHWRRRVVCWSKSYERILVGNKLIIFQEVRFWVFWKLGLYWPYRLTSKLCVWLAFASGKVCWYLFHLHNHKLSGNNLSVGVLVNSIRKVRTLHLLMYMFIPSLQPSALRVSISYNLYELFYL
jgi:hypothetical protein